MSVTNPRVVVVGAGYAGVSAVSELQESGANIDLTWISTEPYHVVRHELHRVIRNPKLRSDLRISIDRICTRDTTFHATTVTAVDPSSHILSCADGTVCEYDYLLLTVGARSAFYGIPGLPTNAHLLETIDDAHDVYTQLDRLITELPTGNELNIVVGGGGLTGVQTAGEIAAMGTERGVSLAVTIVEALEHLLPAESPKLRERVVGLLRERGIDFRTGAPIVEVTPEQVIVATGDGITADLVVWAGGITGCPLTEDGQLELTNNRIRGDQHLQTSDGCVFVAGDAGMIEQPDGYAPPTAQAAWQAGPVAARNILASIRGDHLEPWTFHDKGTVISIGDAAVASDVVGSPVNTFGSLPAQTLKKAIATHWIATHTSWREGLRLWDRL